MNTRIIELRKALNLTQLEFCQNIGITRSTLSMYELGKIPIQERFIITICSIYNVNEEWLRTGKGNMFNPNKKYDEFFTIFNGLNKPLQDFLIRTAKDLLDTQEKL